MNDSDSAANARGVGAIRASVSDRVLNWIAAVLRRVQADVKAPTRRIVFVIVALALAFGSRWLADPFLPPGFPFLTFFPAVVLTTLIAGVRAGTAAALGSALLAWYFFIPPAQSFGLNPGAAVALIFYMVVIGIDIVLIAVMQKAIERASHAEKRSAALAKQRELLFQELQHRVANNLAMISGLLNVQRRIVENHQAKQALAQAASRIALIGQIHRALHDPQHQSFNLGAYLGQLTRDLVEATGAKIDLRLQCEPIDVPGERAMLISLIAAELITNAIKHGIGARPNGKLDIELRRGADVEWASLSVRDDGPGLSSEDLERQSRSLGMQIVESLARQLGGNLHFTNARGTVGQLQFPIERSAQPSLTAAA